ncbi:MAG: type IV pilus twitching motility protein PilT [Candidatus Omnitrophica bacterium]|nr:type IV pilus twitching motility protein PilT [Candidatus Omnitrophota bacterium]
MNAQLKELLIKMEANRASDLHITAHTPMHYRIKGELVKVNETLLNPEEVKNIVFSLMSDVQKERFHQDMELDFSFSIENVARFRANVFLQRGCIGCAIRFIPYTIKTIPECGLPENVVRSFCQHSRGLILVTGSTGSGKSTTLAAMVDEINTTYKKHIITVEDPIEFVHKNKSCVIEQREVLHDTPSFYSALRHVLRQDPDVIFIGELRDMESIQQALIIADTGHLVLATLHTSDCIQSINRIIDVFPSHQQPQIRTQLSFILIGILSQQLLPRSDDKTMALASEILVVTPPVRNMIRDERVHQIYSTIQTSQKVGMKTMNQSLAELYFKEEVTYDTVLSYSSDVEELIKLIGQKPTK